jgi:hypothetical protein
MANADISPESAPAVTRAMTSRVHLSSLCALRGPPLTEANPVLTKRFDEDALATMNMVGLSFAFPRRTLSEFAKAQTWAELDRLKDEEDCDGGGGRHRRATPPRDRQRAHRRGRRHDRPALGDRPCGIRVEEAECAVPAGRSRDWLKILEPDRCAGRES